MIKVQDIRYFSANYGEGQIIKTRKLLTNDKFAQVDVKILKKFPFHCLVQDTIDPKYNWCVQWVDMMLDGGIA